MAKKSLLSCKTRGGLPWKILSYWHRYFYGRLNGNWFARHARIAWLDERPDDGNIVGIMLYSSLEVFDIVIARGQTVPDGPEKTSPVMSGRCRLLCGRIKAEIGSEGLIDQLERLGQLFIGGCETLSRDLQAVTNVAEGIGKTV